MKILILITALVAVGILVALARSRGERLASTSQNLTANPEEHLKRAKKLLTRGRNSDLLYVALELRLALERIVHHELLMCSETSNKMAKQYDPIKKLRHLRETYPATSQPHDIFLINQETGERVPFGQYKPLDYRFVSDLNGRLGNLLHARYGILLGIEDDPWYLDTRKFLLEGCAYLEERYKGNTAYFAFEGLDHIEMVPTDHLAKARS